MKNVLPGVMLVLLAACEPTPPPLPEAPHILSIVPAEQSTSYAQLVTVQLDSDPRFLVNYSEGSAQRLDEAHLWVGDQEVPLVTYLGHGRFQGTVPAGMQARRYDIRVTMGDGREASLANAYEVRTSLPTVGFWIESIGTADADQKRFVFQDEAFPVIIHAAGPDAEDFQGTVTLTLYRGSTPLSSTRTGPFSGGVRQELITIPTSGPQYLVSIQDDAGAGATSNEFRVDPRN